MIRSTVLLPPPLGPSSATSSPLGTSNETLSTTLVAPNDFSRSRTTIPWGGEEESRRLNQAEDCAGSWPRQPLREKCPSDRCDNREPRASRLALRQPPAPMATTFFATMSYELHPTTDP